VTALDLGRAIDEALEQAMAADPTVVVLGEDVPLMRRTLFARFGSHRVRATPISESAFLGAGVGAALGGLRPVVEIMFVDFLPVALHALAGEAALVEPLSGGRWSVPLLVRAACGGGYGDAGQHEHAWWGMLASIPGLVVAVPSTEADAAGLTLTALAHDGPVVLLEHKLLSALWRESVAGSVAARAALDVPEDGSARTGAGPAAWSRVPFGRAVRRREGDDLLLVSVGAGVHLCLDAAARLAEGGVEATVLDLRTVAPLDRRALLEAAAECAAVLVVDEDYGPFGLSGELLAVLAESRAGVRCGRVAATGTIPYARRLEREVLPSTERVVEAARRLLR
jgi:pyruvate dehydrogenase E1 component beta subunit